MHKCDKCGADCDCDRGLPGCEHLCLQLVDVGVTGGSPLSVGAGQTGRTIETLGWHHRIAPTKFWSDVERAAMDDNILHYVVSIVERGDLTREEALIHGILAFAELSQKQQRLMVDWANCNPVAPFVILAERDK